MKATLRFAGGVEAGSADFPPSAMPSVGDIIELDGQPWEVQDFVWHIEGPTKPYVVLGKPR